MELQTSLGLLATTSSKAFLGDYKDPYGRKPFKHPALEGVESLTGNAREVLTHHHRLAQIAQDYGLFEVIRWVPRKVWQIRHMPPLLY